MSFCRGASQCPVVQTTVKLMATVWVNAVQPESVQIPIFAVCDPVTAVRVPLLNNTEL